MYSLIKGNTTGECEMDSSGLGQRRVEGSWEHGIVLLGSIKDEELFYQQTYCYLLKWPLFQRNNYAIAYKTVTVQRLRNKQIYQSRF